MAAPNVDPRFATDSVYASDGDIWASDPTKLDPGSGRQAEGFEPDTLPSEWLNWILNLLGAWVYFFVGLLGGLDGTGEWLYQAAKIRVIGIPGSELAGNRTVGITTGWHPVASAAVGFPMVAVAEAAADESIVDLGKYLSDGDVFTAVLLNCTVPATTTALTAKVWRTVLATGVATQLGSSLVASTSAGTYAPTTSFTTTVALGTYAYTLTITASDAPTPGSIPSEYLNYALLSTTRPGPRR